MKDRVRMIDGGVSLYGHKVAIKLKELQRLDEMFISSCDNSEIRTSIRWQALRQALRT